MKIEFYELEGKKYPLSFSLATTEKIAQKYKDLSKLSGMLKNEKISNYEKIAIVSEILSAMMYSGAQYYNAFNKEPFEGADYKDGKFRYLTAEQLKCVIPCSEKEITDLAGKIQRCYASSNDKDIHARSVQNRSKKKRRR